MLQKFRWAAIATLLVAMFTLPRPALAQESPFYIAASVDNSAQGAIIPSGNVSVAASGNQTFVALPDPGYKVAYLVVDGAKQDGASFTFANVSENHSISASFMPIIYTVTAGSGPNGTISPRSPSLTYHYGDNQTFIFTAAQGFAVADIVVDNVSQGSHGNFTFTNIQSDHSIMVSFSALKPVASAGGGSLGSAKPPAHAPVRGSSPLNVPPLASTVAWLMAVAAMIAVLVLRVMERRANSSWPATFVVRRLEISPKELRPGSQAVVGVTVNNRGQHAGSFKVNLKVDGVPKAEREVTLAGGTSDRVEFSVPATEPGSIAIDVGGLSGTITVKSA